ncbi:VWA domain-containing protein [Aliiroseovarius sp. KMU-50]|uniref:VWA domain-containing protein n=1 Tax=Aliiroseovarius salicola TaxID=3009082 RepID=A0ABT4VXI3_9RHOB|nr:VWA domain-containing protein [Aliiroseovarius sp. KMU-50]MDA5092949.1 VWA domain-containing protein [Aliiroseovarius sp. KMU-50]
MPHPEIDLFEPEETVGKLWHAYASRLQEPEAHDEAAVNLSEIENRLGVFFRGLGGGHAVEIKTASPMASEHRLSASRALGTWRERIARPSFDGEALRLPEKISDFPAREANAALYFWLAASVAHASEPAQDEDLLRLDIQMLRASVAMTRDTLRDCPGLKGFYETLIDACREMRPSISLPRYEEAIEQVILHLLGGPEPKGKTGLDLLTRVRQPEADLSDLAAPHGYRPFRPVPLWPDLRPLANRAPSDRMPEAEEQGDGATPSEGMKKARRSKSDQAERRDSLIMHKFEAIFSWVESMNMNRRIEDDDEDTAKRAADDQDELALGQVSKKTATRLKFHLDLSPEDADREKISGEHMYHEWDHRKCSYLPDHCRVLASQADVSEELADFSTDPKAQRRIRAVKRQFEALRPKRVILPRQLDGDELDLEAAIAAQVELRATGHASNRVYRAARTQDRDLAISVLIDVSRSTEAAIGDRSVIEVEREALAALAWGLDACGDDFAINTFSSLKRDRVYVQTCKDFDEKMGTVVEQRIAGVNPAFYTRLGAAMRHASKGLEDRPNSRKLLLVITDGKPNDLDHYEGRHGIEDSRMAVREARRLGQAVHGVVVDQKGQAWVNRIFGSDGFSIVPDANRLTAALPEIYRHITGGVS